MTPRNDASTRDHCERHDHTGSGELQLHVDVTEYEALLAVAQAARDHIKWHGSIGHEVMWDALWRLDGGDDDDPA